MRLFFDAGSGICLWAGDDEAREKYGYPIELDDLPLKDETVRLGTKLIEKFDTSIDWGNPGDTTMWTEDEAAKFKHEVLELERCISKDLGSQYEILNEVLS